MSKLKGRKLQAILNEPSNWHEVDGVGAGPAQAEFTEAVVRHNKEYLVDKTLPLYTNPGNWKNGRYVGPSSSDSFKPPSSVATVSKQETWTCEVKDVKGCPIAKEPRV